MDHFRSSPFYPAGGVKLRKIHPFFTLRFYKHNFGVSSQAINSLNTSPQATTVQTLRELSHNLEPHYLCQLFRRTQIQPPLLI
ncbi:hypothetical protein GWI33_006636 [Rhynchophorus ferrugineus]|uniref:Uncharacterized protein n=1 Tax=Rhynchophorus ferrugineus TaxID=354439 RepID=A0A834IFH9_RHYFE|nr:hypothetical protein GWI33_006636 [Rhynchophorus ferrugineus]